MKSLSDPQMHRPPSIAFIWRWAGNLNAQSDFVHRGRTFLSTVCVLLWATLLPLPGAAQNGPPTKPPLQQMQGQQGIGIFDHPGYEDEARHERQLQALNADRQKSLVSDTVKLLKLANELNAEVSGRNPDTLTPDQLRKLEQIEKLAHSVKEKMSTSVRGVPPFHMPEEGVPH